MMIAGLKTDTLRDTLREEDDIIDAPKTIAAIDAIKNKKSDKTVTPRRND